MVLEDNSSLADSFNYCSMQYINAVSVSIQCCIYTSRVLLRVYTEPHMHVKLMVLCLQLAQHQVFVIVYLCLDLFQGWGRFKYPLIIIIQLDFLISGPYLIREFLFVINPKIGVLLEWTAVFPQIRKHQTFLHIGNFQSTIYYPLYQLCSYKDFIW